MKVVSALVAFLALCQFQSAAAAGLRSRAMFLPNIKDALNEAKEQSEALKDAVLKSYEKVEDTTGKVIDTGKDVLEDTKDAVEDVANDIADEAEDVGRKIKKFFG
eukprot:TRINITY_DN73716_c0_g1_i1.p2 TRINITY_DN73716_c0_g1~~TRINITY_DN73716_c0_g1_i1.p2  ORF type:complete len:105 (-),score=20.97 TRINITY_DN73716_c0_g1_i1:142-456(-)